MKRSIFIEWNTDPVIYISKAISPAKVSGVYLSEPEKTATVVVQEDQLSLAIGRDGQNARLAAKLTGWRIDIKSLTELPRMPSSRSKPIRPWPDRRSRTRTYPGHRGDPGEEERKPATDSGRIPVSHPICGPR